MSDIKENDLVFLTMSAHAWICRNNASFSIPYSGRFARVIKVLDWDTEEGKAVLRARTDGAFAGKWGEYDVRDFKYILDVYLPEMYAKESKIPGVVVPVVLPLHSPKDNSVLFEKMSESFIGKMMADVVIPKVELNSKETEGAEISGQPSRSGEDKSI